MILTIEWVVLVFFSFLYAARDGISMQLKYSDWRLGRDKDLDAPRGRLMRFPCMLVKLIRGLDVQNIVGRTAFGAVEGDALLDYVLRIDWAKTPSPGYLWYDFDQDHFPDMPRPPAGEDDGKEYLNNPPYAPMLGWMDAPRDKAIHYSPQAVGFVWECLTGGHLPEQVPENGVNFGQNVLMGVAARVRTPPSSEMKVRGCDIKPKLRVSGLSEVQLGSVNIPPCTGALFANFAALSRCFVELGVPRSAKKKEFLG